MKNILVAGGAGYIGSQTCATLAAQGYTPVVLDNLVYGHEWAVKWGPFIRGQIGNRELVSRIIRDYKIDAAIHFAAFTYVGESVQNPLKYYQNNVAETVSFLEVLVSEKVNKFIFSSTCATYGNPQFLPLTEEHPQNPISPYGTTKLMVEKILQDLAKSNELKSVALRYFNASGASPELGLGEEHEPESHLIPLLLKSLLPGGKKISIFGFDYPTPDGTCLRDYIHVADLADAHVKALQKLEKSSINWAAYNLGVGKAFSVLDVIRCAEKVTGLPVSYERGVRRMGDPPELVADSRFAQTELGWAPVCSDLESILTSAWIWHQRQAGIKI